MRDAKGHARKNDTALTRPSVPLAASMGCRRAEDSRVHHFDGARSSRSAYTRPHQSDVCSSLTGNCGRGLQSCRGERRRHLDQAEFADANMLLSICKRRPQDQLSVVDLLSFGNLRTLQRYAAPAAIEKGRGASPPPPPRQLLPPPRQLPRRRHLHWLQNCEFGGSLLRRKC